MKKIELTDAPELEQVIQHVNGEDVVITRNGHAVALVSGFDDDDWECYVREHDPEFLQSLNDAREQIRTGDSVRHEDVEQHLGLTNQA